MLCVLEILFSFISEAHVQITFSIFNNYSLVYDIMYFRWTIAVLTVILQNVIQLQKKKMIE
jgi:hypothetical protein